VQIQLAHTHNTHTHTSAHTHTQTHTHMCILGKRQVYVQITFAHTHNTHTQTHTHTHAYVHTRQIAGICADYISAHTQHTHTQTHTHICRLGKRQASAYECTDTHNTNKHKHKRIQPHICNIHTTHTCVKTNQAASYRVAKTHRMP